jgi:hypothetical protein
LVAKLEFVMVKSKLLMAKTKVEVVKTIQEVVRARYCQEWGKGLEACSPPRKDRTRTKKI